MLKICAVLKSFHTEIKNSFGDYYFCNIIAICKCVMPYPHNRHLFSIQFCCRRNGNNPAFCADVFNNTNALTVTSGSIFNESYLFPFYVLTYVLTVVLSCGLVFRRRLRRRLSDG